jgi:hypothetical protein
MDPMRSFGPIVSLRKSPPGVDGLTGAQLPRELLQACDPLFHRRVSTEQRRECLARDIVEPSRRYNRKGAHGRFSGQSGGRDRLGSSEEPCALARATDACGWVPSRLEVGLVGCSRRRAARMCRGEIARGIAEGR